MKKQCCQRSKFEKRHYLAESRQKSRHHKNPKKSPHFRLKTPYFWLKNVECWPPQKMKKILKAKNAMIWTKSPQFELKTPQFRHSQWFHQKTPHFSTLAGSRHFKFFDATEGSKDATLAWSRHFWQHCVQIIHARLLRLTEFWWSTKNATYTHKFCLLTD